MTEEFPNHTGVHGLSKLLGVTDRTIERWHASGKLPPPDKIGPQKMKLWSPEQRREILRWHLKNRKKKASPKSPPDDR